jgi:hypothetical protein
MKSKILKYKFISIICLLIFLVISQNIAAQKVKKGIVYPFNMEQYLTCDSVTWYGWDFSHLRICDRNAFGYMVKDNYIPIWLDKLTNAVSPNRVCRNLKKGILFSDPYSIQPLYKNTANDNFITSDLFVLSIDSLKSIVKGYKLNMKRGLGFVIIVETMNKPERFVSGYLTFFDLTTREILWTTKMKGLPGGKWGVELFYRNGLLELYDYFIGKYYNSTIRKFTN